MPIKNYHEALKVKTQLEADLMLGELVIQAMEKASDLTLERATAIQRSNIGYCTGDMPNTPEGRAQRKLVLELYQTEHPIFGKYEQEFTPEEMFQAGMIMAQAMKETGGDIAASIKKARESL